MENDKNVGPMVPVAYRDLTGKILVFLIGDHLWEMVAYERWLHLEVQLYLIT